MKKIVSALVLILCGVGGCNNNTPPAVKTGKADGSAGRADLLKPALDQLSVATEAIQYRDALHLLNAYLSKGPEKTVIPLSAQDTATLRQQFGLDAAEAADVNAGLFRPLDAFHVQSCFLFRDAGRQLEIANVPPQQQARIGFEWVIRRIALHEQADESLPASFVLRRGFGSSLDRAVVFLALLRQFQLEGCLLASPDDASVPVLVGVLVSVNQKPSLFLFDPRLGRPIPAPGNQGIATLAEARAHPELLQASGIAPELISKLAAFQLTPLEALSARMRYLQDLLAFHDKVVLFQDTAVVRRDLSKAVGHDAQIENAPPLAKGLAPTRALRLFLTPEEGGVDKRGRYRRFELDQIPWPIIVLQLQDMHLFTSAEIPEPARDLLLAYTRQLFTTFSLQPRDYFLHGQFDATLRRVDRMRNVLETEEAARPLEEVAFQKQLSDWRRRVQEAYISLLVRKEPAGQAKVNALWNEDRYLTNLLKVDSEIPLEQPEKRLLTLILLNACREPLGRQVNYLVASCLHEEAARLQANQEALIAAGQDATRAKENAQSAWRNARGTWNKYIGRYPLHVQSLPKRLAEIAQCWNRGDFETAVALWEELHLEMHTSFEARMRLAEAQEHLPDLKPARQELLLELEAFQKSDLPKNLKLNREKAQGSPLLEQRLDLLLRDWAPRGNVYWLSEAVRGPLEQGK